MSDDAARVILDLLTVSVDEMGVVSAEVLEEVWDFKCLVVSEVAG